MAGADSESGKEGCILLKKVENLKKGEQQ